MKISSQDITNLKTSRPSLAQAEKVEVKEVINSLIMSDAGLNLPSRLKQSTIDNMTEEEWDFAVNQASFRTLDTRTRDMWNNAIMLASEQDTVLITGESGTGKELVAQVLHGKRKKDKFIAVNSAGFPETLIEAELFGYKKGAFTGANEDRKGKIAAAEGGTLFLDEVGDLPLQQQAKLLRAIQTGKYYPLGSNEEKSASVRWVFATNKPIAQWIEENDPRFRADLYYRIAEFELHIPPLRERPHDIPLLIRHFCEINGYTPFTPEEIEDICKLKLLGNVRELLRIIKRKEMLGI